jgi:phosphopantothenoylcysteine decarboxylase/phosphopantothenate--cysteine ligase
VKILVGVTGSIAAYKAAELVRLLIKDGHEVVPVLTRGAERFVRPELFTALARRSPQTAYPHLEPVDAIVVAPASANTLARLAHGLADDLLSEAVLAHRGLLLVAPAMNPRMWASPATQANVIELVTHGVELVGPEEGELGEEGEWGRGRMAEPATIIRALYAGLARLPGSVPGSWHGRRVLVSAGGTREPLDAVRYVGNRSSGKMGVALAEAARRRGATVTLLACHLSVPLPPGVEVVETPTVADLEREALARDFDVFFAAAAPADYRPQEIQLGKRPKDGVTWLVALEPTPDVLKALGAQKRAGQILVGFGVDSAENRTRKAEMLVAKNLDLVVFNPLEASPFDSDRAEFELFAPASARPLGKLSKVELAATLLDEVEQLFGVR